MKKVNNSLKICVIGLGYVGLPLAVELSKKYRVTGYDVSDTRIEELSKNLDITQEVEMKALLDANISFSNVTTCLQDQDVFIVTVPTPIDSDNLPDLRPLKLATMTVAEHMKEGAVIIYESTVYPGVTEEICVPIIEQISNLTLNEDFYVGYSPERINPGDKQRPLTKITKLTSGSDEGSAEFVDTLYRSILDAGTFKCRNIKTAEAAKVLENTQRDVNIALMNEMSEITQALDIDTTDVIKAASTKWNFIPFKPGLVGGHCIGVDPYYLQFVARRSNVASRLITAARIVNNEVPFRVISQIKEDILNLNLKRSNTSILILGETFKENCSDRRNSKVTIICEELKKYDINYEVYDPYSSDSSFETYAIEHEKKFNIVILAVGHDTFVSLGASKLRKFCVKNGKFYDLKGYFDIHQSDYRL